jgi:ferrous iron transport protein A
LIPALRSRPADEHEQPSPLKLAQLAIGAAGAIRRIHGSDEATYRLMEMGLTPGTELVISGIAPLGDPLHITLRGYSLSIRRREAELIEVDRLP